MKKRSKIVLIGSISFLILCFLGVSFFFKSMGEGFRRKGQAEPRILLSGIFTAQQEYFKKTGTFSPIMENVDYQPASCPRRVYFILVGVGDWPVFTGSKSKGPSLLKEKISEVAFYKISCTENRYAQLKSIFSLPKESQSNSFWALSIGSIGDSSKLDIWLVTHESRMPQNIIKGFEPIGLFSWLGF